MLLVVASDFSCSKLYTNPLLYPFIPIEISKILHVSHIFKVCDMLIVAVLFRESEMILVDMSCISITALVDEDYCESVTLLAIAHRIDAEMFGIPVPLQKGDAAEVNI